MVADHAMGCSTTQLAWLDLLRELALFLPRHGALLAELQASAALKELYTKLGHKEEWRSAVKAIHRTLAQARSLPLAASTPSEPAPPSRHPRPSYPNPSLFHR